MSVAEAVAYETLLTETRGNTRIITLNRPGALNALNQQVLADLELAIHEAAADPQVRGVVLTGSGSKAFVAGADISEISQLEYEDAVAFSMHGQRLFAQIEQLSKPVVAAINGFALGGGCELAMACHLRIAAETAKLGQPEVNLGIIAGYGGTQRLPRLVGKTKALELLLTADMIGADEAKTLGLVNQVVPAAQVVEAALALLEKIYTKGPLAVALTIEAVNASFDPTRNGYEAEAILFAKAAHSQDCREGTTAFLEKRKPNFQGR
jgi:enoyl-CoA hydratase